MADAAPLVLLGGARARGLAARLEASGYRTGPLVEGGAGEQGGEGDPFAVVLSPSLEDRIPTLRQRWGAVPILLGIDHDDVEGRSLVLGSGADDLWLTAAGPSDLLTRLRLHRQIWQSAGRNSSSPLVVGDLEVDPQHQTARRGRQDIQLTAREFQLLLLLARHSPNVVGREQILRTIWPQERAAASNVIEVYVRYLRRKLETGDQPRLIHTVRGLGYCLRT